MKRPDSCEWCGARYPANVLEALSAYGGTPEFALERLNKDAPPEARAKEATSMLRGLEARYMEVRQLRDGAAYAMRKAGASHRQIGEACHVTKATAQTIGLSPTGIRKAGHPRIGRRYKRKA